MRYVRSKYKREWWNTNVIGTYCGILVIVDFNCLYRVNSHISEEFLNGITL